MNQFSTRCACLIPIALLFFVAPHATGGLIINIQAGSTLASNAAATAAFDRAANRWEALFSDDVTVNIDADLQNLGNPSTIGQASSRLLSGSYTTIRNAMVADAADEPSNIIVASLPTAAQASFILPAGFGISGSMIATKANLKGLGFAGLDAMFGNRDAQITFNSTFSFDFDNSDGISGSAMDFEAVATHEIGHALGFVSIVDGIDSLINDNQTAPDVPPMPLDLFRFGPTADPETTAEFMSNPRDLRPGVAAFFDDLSTEYLFSTGVTQGDGRQASHWKDNDLTGILIGIMDPTFAFGQAIPISAADIQALDFIGWDQVAAVPEPSIAGFSAVALLVFAGIKRRRIFRCW